MVRKIKTSSVYILCFNVLEKRNFLPSIFMHKIIFIPFFIFICRFEHTKKYFPFLYSHSGNKVHCIFNLILCLKILHLKIKKLDLRNDVFIYVIITSDLISKIESPDVHILMVTSESSLVSC